MLAKSHLYASRQKQLHVAGTHVASILLPQCALAFFVGLESNPALTAWTPIYLLAELYAFWYNLIASEKFQYVLHVGAVWQPSHSDGESPLVIFWLGAWHPGSGGVS